jgi:hypothetical protein
MKKIFFLALLIAGSAFASNPKSVNPKLINPKVLQTTIALAKPALQIESSTDESTITSEADALGYQDCLTYYVPLYFIYSRLYGFDQQTAMSLAAIAVEDCINNP